MFETQEASLQIRSNSNYTRLDLENVSFGENIILQLKFSYQNRYHDNGDHEYTLHFIGVRKENDFVKTYLF
jgi:hypothetical protein